MVTIDLLKNKPDSIPALADIWYDVLGRIWMPQKPLDQVVQGLKSHLNEEDLPLTLVAFEGERPIGMCSLRVNDGISPNYLPVNDTGKAAWLGSLVVDATHQHRGVGAQLIREVCQKAKGLGFEQLYLFAFDPTIPTYYARLGWATLGMDTFNGHPVTVMGIEV